MNARANDDPHPSCCRQANVLATLVVLSFATLSGCASDDGGDDMQMTSPTDSPSASPEPSGPGANPTSPAPPQPSPDPSPPSPTTPVTPGSADVAFGSVGSGDVSCSADGSTSCSAGSLCCMEGFGFPECVATREACGCEGDYGDCGAIACDGPEDCPNAACCATRSPDQGTWDWAGTSCKPACAADIDVIVCKEDGDCDPGDTCMQDSMGFLRCF